MRILMVTEASSGGTGRHIVDLTEGLRARGCSVSVAYSPLRRDPPFRAFLAGCDAGSRREIRMRRGPHWADGKALLAIRRMVRRDGPFDIVHAHSSKAGLLVRSAGLRRKTVVLYTPHGVFTNNPTNSRMSRMIGGWVERTLAARCDGVIAVSPDETEHLADLIPQEKVHYVPNGVRPLAWRRPGDARADIGLAGRDELVVGFVGRMLKEKNPLLLVNAFGAIATRCKRVLLAIVGDGPLLEVCRARVRELGLQDRVLWLGYRQAEEVLPAFDVMAIPSSYESLPYVLLEALSAGTPVVATAIGGMKMVVEHLRNGLLVDSQEPAAFGAALERVLADGDLRRRMAVHARESAAAYTSDVMVDRTLALYGKLRAARTQPAPALALTGGPKAAAPKEVAMKPPPSARPAGAASGKERPA